MEELHYIGVDVSKHTLDFAVYDGCLDLKDGHIQVGNDSKGFTTFARWIKGKGIEYDQVRLCMELLGCMPMSSVAGLNRRISPTT